MRARAETAELSNALYAEGGGAEHSLGSLDSQRANMFATDTSRHIVYAANWGAGLWRLVTR